MPHMHSSESESESSVKLGKCSPVLGFRQGVNISPGIWWQAKHRSSIVRSDFDLKMKSFSKPVESNTCNFVPQVEIMALGSNFGPFVINVNY